MLDVAPTRSIVVEVRVISYFSCVDVAIIWFLEKHHNYKLIDVEGEEELPVLYSFFSQDDVYRYKFGCNVQNEVLCLFSEWGREGTQS